jgi:hypothetical protein
MLCDSKSRGTRAVVLIYATVSASYCESEKWHDYCGKSNKAAVDSAWSREIVSIQWMLRVATLANLHIHAQIVYPRIPNVRLAVVPF